ncbi:hypothetical protein E4633_03700 [Geomonas terrae]|uniref:Uncharacterized protein n=1 Tax=Geomonas terrae TaxID=2562681 RepID=A0A4S1CLG9_9BACT|nr:hypothetical protein [Geomonas terrae]TGU74579.1 hypothetical protein E4633_03700 [Geomonas terrae]
MIDLNGWPLLKLALTTGVITAIINQAINWVREYYKEKGVNTRCSRYSALRLAVILEGFAISCADDIAEMDMYRHFGGEVGRKSRKLPLLDQFPADIDWRVLDPSLSTKVLSFHNDLALAQQVIGGTYDIDPECGPDACLDQLGICGYRAWGIAEALRERYQFPQHDPKEFSWDVVECLKNKFDSAINKKGK